MILIKHIQDLQTLLKIYSDKHFSIGFVPTMGALHSGHISLIDASRAQHPLTVCSIFINPTQFNNPQDFEKYPVSIEDDIRLLETAGCDILFLPSAQEMYPEGEAVKSFDLGYIETILEGAHRPGHFQGVCRIVHKLLSLVRPHTIYVGQKDYQQCLVIKKLLALENCGSQMTVCPTMREPGGLAMSSRNIRLSESEKNLAVSLYVSLRTIQATLGETDISKLKEVAKETLTAEGFIVDYVEIAHADSLLPASNVFPDQPLVGLVAASIAGVRLIDNLVLN